MAMRIAVMGTSGVGGYFGARLALGGCGVTFIARSAHDVAVLHANGRMPA
jgi:2-dehydropantoate 2-reductase